MTSVGDALRARISIRAFSEEPVSRETVEALLETARWAPSGGNMQPWKVVVVAGAARDRVIEVGQSAIMRNPAGEAEEHPVYPSPAPEPYRSRRYKLGEDMYALLEIPREDKGARLAWMAENFKFFGAPVGLFFVIDRCMGHGQWAHMGMFMQSLALAATEAGYGTCMQEAWAMVRKSLHGHFALAPEEIVYCGMALGRPDPDAPVNRLRSERAPVAEFARFDGFES